MSAPSMRELFFNEAGVRELAARLSGAWPDFAAAGFIRDIVPKLGPLGLNERNYLIRDTLRRRLPQDYPRALAILLQAMGPEYPTEGPASYPGFVNMSLCAYVAAYGLDHVELSLAALREMTKRFSAEFAIRPFLDRYPGRTLAELARWAKDPHPQVRRLVSEGTRPRLPWGLRLQRFVRDPRPALPLLEQLKEDPELFVRRSVANHLNDIAKDHPDLVVDTLRRWKRSPRPETGWLVKHALRTLIKQGHPRALELLGFGHGAEVAVSGLRVARRKLAIGETQSFQFRVVSTSARAQPLMMDYAIHYRKANGTLKPKVFKLKSLNLAPGAAAVVAKNHPFRPIGIRPFYPGAHAIEVLINGRSMGRVRFHLRAPARAAPVADKNILK